MPETLSNFVTMQQKRGPSTSLPTSAPAGQLLVTTDTKALYVGTGTGIAQIGDTYTFNQPLAAATWTINHNLNKYPSVVLVNADNEVVVADIQYTSANQIICNFSPAMSGKAYLN